ncbi:hypothetical protein HZB01_01370 [Candidatus Woesearchaeota archaeon]|nr:hypothetical protein [Candidatus Woesearchaeota archaeon]
MELDTLEDLPVYAMLLVGDIIPSVPEDITENIVKRIDCRKLTGTVDDLLMYLLSPQPDNFNTIGYTPPEIRAAERIHQYLEFCWLPPEENPLQMHYYALFNTNRENDREQLVQSTSLKPHLDAILLRGTSVQEGGPKQDYYYVSFEIIRLHCCCG